MARLATSSLRSSRRYHGRRLGGRCGVVDDRARNGHGTIMPLRVPGTTRGGRGGSVLRRPQRFTVQAPRLNEDMSADRPAARTRDPSRPRRARARRPLPGRADGLGRRQHPDRRRRGHRARPPGDGQAGPPGVGRVGGVPRAASRPRCATMSALSHPNIAAVHDWGEEQIGKRTTVYAVVEYLSGGSLRDLFDRGRYLDPSQALVVGLEACRGLDFAHRKGLVHTELTPSKLVFGDDRRLRIVDFGLARLLGEHDWARAGHRRHPRRPLQLARAGARPADRRQDRRVLAGADPRRGGHRHGAVRRPLDGGHAVGPHRPADAGVGRPRPAGRRCWRRRAGRSRPTARRPPSSAAPSSGRPRSCPARRRSRSLVTGAVRRRPEPDAPAERPDRRDHPSRPGRRARRPRAAGAGSGEPAAEPAADVAAGAATTPEEAAAVAPSRRWRPIALRQRARGRRPLDVATPLPPPVVEAVDEARRGSTTATPTAPIDELAAARQGDRGRRRPPAAGGARRRPEPRRPGLVRQPGDHGRRAAAPAVAGLARRRPRGRRPRRARVPRLPAVPRPHPRGAGARRARRGGGRGADRRLRLGPRRRARSAATSSPSPATIIRTAPAAGERLAEGEPFLIVVSEGPEFRDAARPRRPAARRGRDGARRAAPRRPAADAAVRRDRAGRVGDLVVGAGGAAHSSPATRCCPSTEVALVVSTGPGTAYDPDARRAAGRRRHGPARRRCSSSPPSASRCSATTSRPATWCRSTPGRRRPRSPRGSTVTLVPSKGVDLVVMPDLTGQTLDQAGATLAGGGAQRRRPARLDPGPLRRGDGRRRPGRSRRPVQARAPPSTWSSSDRRPRSTPARLRLVSVAAGQRKDAVDGISRRARGDHHRSRAWARAGSTPCCSPPKAPRSWSTTAAAPTTAPAPTTARPTRSSPRSRRAAARPSPTATTSPTGRAPSASSTRPSTPSATSTSSSTTPASCATGCSST